MATTINERTAAELSGKLVQRNGAAINATQLDFLVVSIFRTGFRSSFLRLSDDMLEDANFVRRTDGTFTWALRPFETALLQSGLTIGSVELHTHFIRYGWDSIADGELTNPFATTLDDQTVVITHANHGLAVNDSVCFVGCNRVGGLDFDSCFVVSRVIDANSYEIEHPYAATSTASGGGTCHFYQTDKTGSGEYQVAIRRNEP